MQLVNETVNSLYVTPHVGASLGRLMEESLRWPRFGSSMTSAGLCRLRYARFLGFHTGHRQLVVKALYFGAKLGQLRLCRRPHRRPEPREKQASEALSATRYGVWKPAGGPVRWRSELE